MLPRHASDVLFSIFSSFFHALFFMHKAHMATHTFLRFFLLHFLLREISTSVAHYSPAPEPTFHLLFAFSFPNQRKHVFSAALFQIIDLAPAYVASRLRHSACCHTMPRHSSFHFPSEHLSFLQGTYFLHTHMHTSPSDIPSFLSEIYFH